MHTAALAGLPSSLHAVMIVDLSAVTANYHILQDRVGKSSCYPALKGDAYGVGAIPVIFALYKENCRNFFVGYADEGVRLRHALLEHNIKDVRIFVLNGYFPGAESSFEEYHLIPVLTDLEQIARRQARSHLVGHPLPSVLHVDTGMSRTGLPSKEVQQLSKNPQLLQGIDVCMIMSHLAYNYNDNMAFSHQQREQFDAHLALLPKAPAALGKSGTCFLGPEFHYDVMRPGVSIYGGNSTSITPSPLKEVVSIYARIYQVQNLDAGMSVGYSQTYIAQSDRRVATLTMGYADGYSWRLANKRCVSISGYKAPIIGRISMDLLTVDVTDVPDELLGIGDWVQVVGPHNTVDDMAADAGLSPHSTLTGLGKRFQRVYVGEVGL